MVRVTAGNFSNACCKSSHIIGFPSQVDCNDNDLVMLNSIQLPSDVPIKKSSVNNNSGVSALSKYIRMTGVVSNEQAMRETSVLDQYFQLAVGKCP